MRRTVILGIPIDAVTAESAVLRLRALLETAGPHHVTTPNNEMLVAAVRDPAFAAVLRRSALNLPDSTGVVWASRRKARPLPERVTGVDTVVRLCAELDESHPIFLLGAAPGVAEAAGAALVGANPRLRIAGAFAGSPTDADAADILRRIEASGAHLLLVAYGAPAQDLWIDRHLPRLRGVRVAMGIGGTFDFLAGTRTRAPAILRRLGLEWAWRLLQEPRRLPRILTAVVVFPFYVLTRRVAATP